MLSMILQDETGCISHYPRTFHSILDYSEKSLLGVYGRVSLYKLHGSFNSKTNLIIFCRCIIQVLKEVLFSSQLYSLQFDHNSCYTSFYLPSFLVHSARQIFDIWLYHLMKNRVL